MLNQNTLVLSLTLVILFISNPFTGQEKLVYKPSVEFLIEAEELLKEDKIEKALQAVNNVYHGDSLFYKHALPMKMRILNYLERYEEVKQIGDEYWFFRHELPTGFYLIYGTALDQLELFDEAQGMYRSILEEFPINHSLWYNYSVSLNLSGNKEESFKALKRTVEINPFYDRAHLSLAALAASEKQTTRALMALGMHMWLSVYERNNFQQLRYADYIASSKYWTEENFEEPSGIDLGDNAPYEMIDQIVHNYVATREKYKTPSKLSYPFINQCHLIFSQFEKIKPDENDFWFRTYSSFFKKLLDEGQFEGWSYFVSSYVENESTQKIVKKKSKKSEKFYDWAVSTLDNLKSYVDLDYEGFGEVKVLRGDNHLISILGDFEITSNGESLIGDATFINTDGRISSVGSFNNKGQKIGEWKYFHNNGYLREIEFFENGVNVDSSAMYFPNGYLRYTVTYKNGEIDGEVKLYNNGVLEKTVPYENGGIGSGRYVEYHPSGAEKLSYELKDGKANGKYKEYFITGELYREGEYKEGSLVNKRTTYFRNGQISYIENYKDDQLHGEYLSYYNDGVKEREGKYDEGVQVGEWRFYFHNGSLQKVQELDESGKQNGVEKNYTKQGWLLSEINYKKGEIDSYKFYDKDGGILSEDSRKMGKLNFVSYFDNGNINTKGKYDKDGLTGKWEYYNLNGTKTRERTFKGGESVGDYTDYYINGNVSQKYKFEDGSPEGYYLSNFRTGDMHRQGFLDKGYRDGPWKDYYVNGQVREENFYSGRKSEGFKRQYNVDGKLESSAYYIDDFEIFNIRYDTSGVAFDTIFNQPGKREVSLRYCASCPVFMTVDVVNNKYHGTQTFFFPDGSIQSKGEMINGTRHGDWVYYNPDGNIRLKATYQEGEREGEWTYYYENQEVEDVYRYSQGKLHGKRTSYDEQGRVSFKANYFYGDLHGKINYYIDGQLDHTRNYIYGFMQDYTYLKGKDSIKKKLINETGDVEIYWSNGKLARKYTITNGWFEGKYEKYYKSGKPYSVTYYVNDNNHGELKKYHENGKLMYEANYVHGNADGTVKSFYPNGKLESEKNYNLGVLDGWSHFYQKDGSLKYSVYYVNGDILDTKGL